MGSKLTHQRVNLCPVKVPHLIYWIIRKFPSVFVIMLYMQKKKSLNLINLYIYILYFIVYAFDLISKNPFPTQVHEDVSLYLLIAVSWFVSYIYFTDTFWVNLQCKLESQFIIFKFISSWPDTVFLENNYAHKYTTSTWHYFLKRLIFPQVLHVFPLLLTLKGIPFILMDCCQE